jgi:branched-chain amino acid transport system substrate-binding protein
MTAMRRLALLLLSLFAAAPAWALPAAPGASDPNLVVGIIATLSGPGALAGQDSVDGFNLAMRHLGGRFANQEVRVVVVDDHGSADTAVAAARRMIERDRVDFVLTATSQASMAALAPILLKTRVFVLNLGGQPAAMSGPECSPWLFQLSTPPQAVNEAAGLWMTGEHLRRIAVIGPDSLATDEAVATLKLTFPGEVAAVIKPHHGAAQYSAEISRLREVKPDAVYSLLTGGMGVEFVRAFAASGLKPDVVLAGPWMAFERAMLPAMAEAAADLPNFAPWSPDLDTPQNKRMVTDFEAEHGRAASPWVAQGYDAALALDSSLRATGGRTTDHDAVRTALRRADFASVRGAFRFNTNHTPVINLYLRRVGHDAKGRLNQELRGVLIKDWRDRQAATCPMRWTEEPAQPQKAPQPGKPLPPPGMSKPTSPKPVAPKPH